MSDAVLCGMCNHNEAAEKCVVCGIDLCEMCRQVVQTEDISASHRVKGISTEGALGPAQKRRTVCAKCMAETDFIDKDDHEPAAAETKTHELRKDRLKGFKQPKEGEVTEKVGDLAVDLGKITPDIRGNEDLVRQILRDDYIETRVKQYETKIRPFTRAEDLAEWDRILLKRYRPLYTQSDPKNGSSAVQASRETALALGNLEEHVSAATKAVASAREVLTEALKVFGSEKAIELGQSIVYPTCNIAALTGFEPKNLAQLDQALSYAEAQLIEQASVVSQGGGDPLDLESRALHLGSLQFLATEVEELVKICCFESLSTGDLPVKEMAFYPEARTPVGLGTVDQSRPVLAFFGDDCLPILYTVGRLEEEDLAPGIEITGLGNAGHELVRLYPAGKVLTSTGKAIKGIRSGIPDLIVASRSCYPLDVIGQAKKAGIPVLATGSAVSVSAPDLSEEPVEKIVGRLKEAESLVVRSVEKAADAVAAFFKDFPGKMGKVPDPAVIEQGAKKCTGCDACFHVCPNSLLISTALKNAGGASLADLYDRCLFCGECEAVCAEEIPVMDCLLAAAADKVAADKFRMRPGRGPLSHLEFRDLTFGLVLGGNGPGMVSLLGCGHYPGGDDELADMAKELLDRNCVVMTAGCAAGDVARKLDEETGKAFPENYPSMATLKGLVNCGGCSADTHIMASMYKFAQLGGGISGKANFDQVADYSLNRAPFAVIIWGPASDKMMAKASGFARIGAPVVIGPSGFKFKRMLVGNKYTRDDWTMYDGIDGSVREVDPSPPHLIFPVETKEEAVAMALKLCFTTCALREPRLSTIDNYTEIHQKYFHSLPDDWTYYLRSPLELHVMKRMRLLKILRDEHGWEVERTTANRVRNRNGELVTMDQYIDNYGIKQGRYATMLKRLIMREAVKE
jgi:acetyl-CoA decarbonylase/synthase complex subunit alpha